MYNQNINWNQIINYQIKSNTSLTLTNFDALEINKIDDIINNNKFKNFIYRKDINKEKPWIILDFKSDEKANSIKLILEKEINNILIDLKVNNHMPQDTSNIISFDLGKKYVRSAKNKNDIKNNSKKYLKDEFPTLEKSKKVLNPISDNYLNSSQAIYKFFEKNKNSIKINKNLIKYNRIPIKNNEILELEHFIPEDYYDFEESKFRKSSYYSGKSMKKKNK